MKLYWKPMWMTDADAKRTLGDPMGNGFMMSNERLEKILLEAYERGKKDGASASERKGIVTFGTVVREIIRRWPLAEGQHGPALVPAWALEETLEQWNIPPLAEDAVKEER